MAQGKFCSLIWWTNCEEILYIDGLSLTACIQATHVTLFKHWKNKEENLRHAEILIPTPNPHLKQIESEEKEGNSRMS